MNKEEIIKEENQSETEDSSIAKDDNKSDDHEKNLESKEEISEKITPEQEIELLKDN